jgi:hypothetical protein
LHWLAHLQAATPCEPLRRKPRAIAISPAPNRSCYTAGIRHLLEPKRSVTGGLNQIAQPLAQVGSPIGDLSCEPLRRKPRAIAISPTPNRWCYTAGIHHLLEPRRSVAGGLNQIAQPLAQVGSPIGDLSCEPLRRKPRAIAISPAPNGSCCTAGIRHLLEPRRSVIGGLNQIAQPLAQVGSPIGDLPCEPRRRKPRAIAISPAPNRWCYTAGNRHLLEPRRSVAGGAESNRPIARAGWLTDR